MGKNVDTGTIAVIGFFLIIGIAVILDGIRSIRRARIADCREFLRKHPEYCYEVCDVCKENPHRR